MLTARAAPDAGTAAAVKRACEEWNAALADGSCATRATMRKLCSDHVIHCTRKMRKDVTGEAVRVVRDVLAKRLRTLTQRTLISDYLPRRAGAAFGSL